MNKLLTGFYITLAVLFWAAGTYLNYTDRDGDGMTLMGVLSFIFSKPWRWMP